MISVIIPVFRNAFSAVALIDALLQQRLPPDLPLEIIVVDDGSNDGHTDLLRRREDEQVRLLELPHNVGRSLARNAGAKLASGSLLLFLDSDCKPANPTFLINHLETLWEGHVASCGPIAGNGNGFWSRYQDDVSARRARQHASGISYSGSTANFLVRASAFFQTDGFDSRYVHYGFEDRDLLVRLSCLGSIGWCEKAVVIHLDHLSLPAILKKTHFAAGGSALLFSKDHPEAYRTLGYRALDARLHAWLRPLASLAEPALGAAPAVDGVLCHPRTPYPVAKTIAKLFFALAFISGTLSRARATPKWLMRDG